MRNQNTGPLPAILGIFMTLICLALMGASIYVGIQWLPERPVVSHDLPKSLEEVKASCADGECLEDCILHAAEEVGYELYPPVMDSDYESELVSYKVNGDQLLEPHFQPISSKLIVYQRNAKAHQRIWNYFISLIPAERRPGLGEFAIYSGGYSGAQFASLEDGSWMLRVNVLDATDPEFLTQALIHEFGHFLTLNPSQQVSLSGGEECAQEPLFGCPSPDSYVNRFFEDYWSDLYPEWIGIKGATNYDQLLSRFYTDHYDQFVTEYAASEPLEDIAETWTAFVLRPRPSGSSIASLKIRSFYQYQELVDVRFEIITGLCTYESPANQ